MKLELDPAGIERILSAPGAAAVATGVARAVAQDAQRLDPVKHRRHEIRVGRTRIDRNGVVVEVETTDWFWAIIEYGSINNPPYRPITRAAQNAGLRFTDAR